MVPFFFIFLLALSPAALADDLPIRNYLAGPHYNRLAQEAAQSQPGNFRFNNFRIFYSLTAQYDPVGRETLGRLKTLAETAIANKGKPEGTAAQAAYKALLMQHLANLDAVTLALSHARQNPALGDAAMLGWLRQGLLDSVTSHERGHSLDTAHRVISAGEEAALLAALNVDVLARHSRQSGTIYYNLYDVRSRATGEEYALFVDITIPVGYMQWLYRQRNANTLRLPYYKP